MYIFIIGKYRKLVSHPVKTGWERRRGRGEARKEGSKKSKMIREKMGREDECRKKVKGK